MCLLVEGLFEWFSKGFPLMPGISSAEGSPMYRAICKWKQPTAVQSCFKINPKAFAIVCQMACYSEAQVQIKDAGCITFTKGRV